MTCNWASRKLEELISIKHGFAFKGKFFTDEETFDYLITPGNFAIGGGFKGDKFKYYNGPVPEDYILEVGDLVVTMTDLSKQADTLGYSALIPELENHRILHNQRVGLIQNISNEIDKEFLYFLLRSKEYRHHVVSGATGTTVKHTSPTKILSYEFQLPPIEVQRKVAKSLIALEQRATINSKCNETLEEMAQAIFKSWFVDFDPVKAKMNGEQPEGMDAATASLFPEKLVESELGLIPEGWPVDQVGNHIDVTKGKSYKSAELQESTTALVTLKSFKRGGGYRMDGLKEYTGKYKPQQVIEAGDLVMSLTDVTQAAEIVGKPALVIDAPQYDTLVASLDVAILRPKETDAKQYFYGLMSTYRFHRYADSFATGTTVLHLSPKGITTFEFACPSAELVKKYHEFAEPIFAKIEANILESQELANLRDTLLPKLLSGEIELGETEEMAEVN